MHCSGVRCDVRASLRGVRRATCASLRNVTCVHCSAAWHVQGLRGMAMARPLIATRTWTLVVHRSASSKIEAMNWSRPMQSFPAESLRQSCSDSAITISSSHSSSMARASSREIFMYSSRSSTCIGVPSAFARMDRCAVAHHACNSSTIGPFVRSAARSLIMSAVLSVASPCAQKGMESSASADSTVSTATVDASRTVARICAALSCCTSGFIELTAIWRRFHLADARGILFGAPSTPPSVATPVVRRRLLPAPSNSRCCKRSMALLASYDGTLMCRRLSRYIRPPGGG